MLTTKNKLTRQRPKKLRMARILLWINDTIIPVFVLTVSEFTPRIYNPITPPVSDLFAYQAILDCHYID